MYAVKNHYWYQMYIDDLPVWGRYYCKFYFKFHVLFLTIKFLNFSYIVGVVGEIESEEHPESAEYYIWTHKKLDIGYNGKHIVDVNLTSESKKKLTLGAKIGFTYEVNWKKSTVKFEDRFDKYLDPNFFQHRVSI